MSEQSQRQELHRKIWSIADDVRGAVDGWDFKQYILGILFYRFISENFTNYIEGGDDSIDYASMSDDVITPEIKMMQLKQKDILSIQVNFLLTLQKMPIQTLILIQT